MSISYAVFCLNKPSTTTIYTLSLHDALPICNGNPTNNDSVLMTNCWAQANGTTYATASLQSQYTILPFGNLRTIAGTASTIAGSATITLDGRSEEHTSELQSHVNLVCRLLLE